MNQGKYVFSQLTDFLPKRIFDGLVTKYNGNKHVRHYSCWNQLLSMIFGQLAGRDSLRDLMVSIEPHKPKYYHLGFGKGTSRSNFANANEKRDCRIFEEYAFHLINLARKASIVDPDFLLNIERFWRSLKYDHVYIFPADDGLDLYKGLKGYFHYYNNELAHQGIGRQTPAKLYRKAA